LKPRHIVEQKVMRVETVSSLSATSKLGADRAGRPIVRTIARAIATFLLTVAVANSTLAQSKATGGPTPSPEGAKVYFVDLKDGAVIGSPTTIHFGLRGMGVAPAGSDKANSGHHHLLIDAELPPLDEPIPNDPNHMHFGGGQTEVDLALTPGPHTLQLLLGDRNHIPHSPPVMSELIHVTVADAASAPSPTAAATAASSPPAAPAATGARHSSPPDAKTYIVSPVDGAAVPLTLQVQFGLDNMVVVRAGVDMPNSGHHHLLIDAPLPPLDEPIPNDENHLHFGAGQTEATITLTPGKHTLQLLLGDANHMPHIPPVFSKPITIFAGEAPQQKTCKLGETLDPSGACTPRVAAPAANGRPLPRHIESNHPSHRGGAPFETPMHRTARQKLAPSGPAAPDAAPAFNDLRPCQPGMHSESFPNPNGYRCVPN
jgi:hypothetical protein